MNNLPFFNEYSGHSTDDLIALEGRYRIDSIVLAFEHYLLEKADRDGLSALTTAELTVLAIEALEREVNNGGYVQFFDNSSVRFAPSTIDALERIGCAQVADITKNALDALNLPEITVSAIEEAICPDEEAFCEKFNKLDSQYYAALDKDISEQLFNYIKANRNQIRL